MNSIDAKILNGSDGKSGDIPTVGYFPEFFPRDPIEVNTYQEHMLLGQVLETLVETNKYGKIMPGVAKSWIFEGNKIIFFLNRSKFFSNGKNITAKDVVYSIERHILNTSQSSNLLSSIEKISVIDTYKIQILIKEKRISLIKALSREQLGIVPEGWVFNKESSEPYIGSGDFRLNKIDNEWILTLKNETIRDIKKWKLVIGSTDNLLTTQDIPTYVPVVIDDLKNKVLSSRELKNEKFRELNSYTQSSAWVLMGKSVSHNKMSILNKYIDEICAKNGYERVTGVVPKGIEGYLNEKPVNKFKPAEKLIHVETLNISVLSFMFKDLFEPIVLKKILADYNLDIRFTSVNILELKKELQAKEADMIIARWGGGFNDPEGFLAILSRVLSTPFEAYLGDPLNKIYAAAKKEENPEKRAELFRELGRQIILNLKMLPLWETKIYSLLNENYEINEFDSRYSPRFIDVKIK